MLWWFDCFLPISDVLPLHYLYLLSMLMYNDGFLISSKQILVVYFRLFILFLCHNLVFFVAFCIRFNYMHYDKKHGPIYKSIEALDKMGIDIIETGDPDSFKKYLLEYDNTICGRHPISVFLHVRACLLLFSWTITMQNYHLVFIYLFFEICIGNIENNRKQLKCTFRVL